MIFRPSFLIRSMLCSCSFSLACSCSLCVFEGFEALILEFRSPRSLKPWVAAGGREAMQINEDGAFMLQPLTAGPSGGSTESIFPIYLTIFTCFSSCFAAPFRLRFRLRATLRALLFPSFQVKDIEFESPGPQSPWVAAGGRKAKKFQCSIYRRTSSQPCTQTRLPPPAANALLLETWPGGMREAIE